MGCFLACFGLKEKKKKKKRPNKHHPSSVEQDNQSYVPLDSNVAIKLDIKDNLTSDISQLKEKPKEPSILKLKKKVSFNLNVKDYEPIPDYDELAIYLSDGEETKNTVSLHYEEPSILKLKKKVSFNLNVKAYEPIPDYDELAIYLSDGEETKNTVSLHYEEDAITSSIIASYPANYRYQNCRYSDDEEDEDLRLGLDLDDQLHEETDEEEYNVSSDDEQAEEEDFAWVDDNDVTKYEEQTSADLQLQRIESKSRSNARDRRQYVSSVLNPVENLSQWKVVKGKAATAQFKLQKENLNMNPCPTFLKTRNQNVTVAVDGSLSNWLEKEKLPLIKSSSSSDE